MTIVASSDQDCRVDRAIRGQSYKRPRRTTMNDDGFHGDGVHRVVAEIVSVVEPVALGEAQVAEQHAGSILFVFVVLVAAVPIARAADLEQVHVTVLPAHGELEDVVELRQRVARRDLDASPDRRLDIQQLDVKRMDGTMQDRAEVRLLFTVFGGDVRSSELPDGRTAAAP